MPGPTKDQQDELIQRLRQELDRMRKAETDATDALGSLRSARKRAEEALARIDEDGGRVRSLVREELWAAGVGRSRASAPAAPPTNAAAGPERPAPRGERGEEREESRESKKGTLQERAQEAENESPPIWHRTAKVVGAALVLLSVVAVAAWLVFNELQDEPEGVTVAGDEPGLSAPPARDAGEAGPAEQEEEEAAFFFGALPEDPALKAQVYDSLWSTRSELFGPLLQQVEDLSDERSVQRALDAWRQGPMTPLQEDVLHSALVQLVLREEVDGDLSVDGTLLRNPCRGESCSALLNVWEIGREEHGLPEMPDDAPRNARALHTVEAVLLLDAMERAAGA